MGTRKYSLRRIGNDSVIVEIMSHNVNLSRVYTLNETASWIWDNMDRYDRDPLKIAQKMSTEFKISVPDAASDIERQLQQWVELGLITEEDR